MKICKFSIQGKILLNIVCWTGRDCVQFIQLCVTRSNGNRQEIKFKLKRAAGTFLYASFAAFAGGGKPGCNPASHQVTGEEFLKIFCVFRDKWHFNFNVAAKPKGNKEGENPERNLIQVQLKASHSKNTSLFFTLFCLH